MVKILSQAGISLADTYDVQGSIAGIEQLNSDNVSLIHEMGQTIFSERLVGTIERRTTGDLLQNISYNIIASDITEVPGRVMGVMCFVDIGARLNMHAVYVHDSFHGREIPIFVWDSNNDGTALVRISDDAAAAATLTMLQPVRPLATVPSMLTGTDRNQSVDFITIRGQTLGFGAGTIDITTLIYLAFPESAGGLSSEGLPLPSW